MGRLPPPPPPPMLPPPAGSGTPCGAPNGASPWPSEAGAAGGGSGRKRSRWDRPASSGWGGENDAAAAPADAAAPPRVMLPPGFGVGPAWPRPPGGSPPRPPSRLASLAPGDGGEPPSKRLAGEGANGSAAGLASLSSAPSWDVETQFAVGTYVSAAGGVSGGNLSPDAASTRGGGAQTYSPVAGGSPGQQAAAALAGGSGRPMSAAYSHAASGGGEAAGNGGPHLSPMSDEEGALPPADLPAPSSAQQAQQAEGQEGEEPEAWDTPDSGFAAYVAEMVRRRVGKYAQPDHPMCISQEEAGQVGAGWTVQGPGWVCVGPHAQQEQPAACLPPRHSPSQPAAPPHLFAVCVDMPQLYSKIRREIVAKEQQAYEQRQGAGLFKPIERSKLEVSEGWVGG